MDKSQFNQGLLNFIQRSPTPFHAVDVMVETLKSHGFKHLNEDENWELKLGGRYCITRNDSSLIAFSLGDRPLAESGIRMIGAHTDSPCLMVKPQAEIKSHGYLRLGVEVYGGALLNPWFDRDLSLAGRVIYKAHDSEQLKQALINFERPVAVIPSLAIHLDREANKKRSVNPQTDIPPIFFQCEGGEAVSFKTVLAQELIRATTVKEKIEVMGYELSCYDTQPPGLVGLNEEFIASARLDNLLSCFTGLQALLTTESSQTCLLVCSDHEEVGSASACGAQGPFLQTILERLLPDSAARSRAVDRSLLISADNAHGIHPNFPSLSLSHVSSLERHQRYATNSITASQFRQWAERAGVSVQDFVSRTDLACGSTIGPITASEIGVATLDVGVPTFAMHSIRELAGRDDAHALYRVMLEFFLSENLTI